MLACTLPASLWSEPPGDGKALLILLIQAPVTDLYAVQGLILQGVSWLWRGAQLSRSPAEGNDWILFCNRSSKGVWEASAGFSSAQHLLLIGAADLAHPKFTCWGRLHAWFHPWATAWSGRDGRNRCWEEQGTLLMKDAKGELSFLLGEEEMWPFSKGLNWSPPSCSFSSACPVPRPAAVSSLLLTQETIHPRDAPGKCMHARCTDGSWCCGLVPLSRAGSQCWVTRGKLRG